MLIIFIANLWSVDQEIIRFRDNILSDYGHLDRSAFFMIILYYIIIRGVL